MAGVRERRNPLPQSRCGGGNDRGGEMSNDTPPPGSDAAILLKCTCPVLDNNHGRGVYKCNGEMVYWINADCPVHGVDATATT